MDNLQFNNENSNTNGTKPNQQIVKYGIIAGCAVVALIVVIALFSALFGKSYKTPIKEVVALINDKTESGIEFSKYERLESEYEFYSLSAEVADKEDEAYETYLDELKDEYGDNFKVKFKIDDAVKLDKDDLKDLADDLEDEYEVDEDEAEDYLDVLEEAWDEADVSSKDQKKLTKAYEAFVKECDKIKVSAAYEVDLECTIKGSEDKEDFRIKDLVIAKVNGEWIFVSGRINPSVIYSKTIED